MWANFQEKQTALTFFSQTCPKLDLGLEIQETNAASASSKYFVCQFSGKTDNFDFFHPNLPKSGFWARNFQNLSPDLVSSSSSYHKTQFLDKTENLVFFGLNLGKLLNFVRWFGSYIVGSYRMLQTGGRRLK